MQTTIHVCGNDYLVEFTYFEGEADSPNDCGYVEIECVWFGDEYFETYGIFLKGLYGTYVDLQTVLEAEALKSVIGG